MVASRQPTKAEGEDSNPRKRRRQLARHTKEEDEDDAEDLDDDEEDEEDEDVVLPEAEPRHQRNEIDPKSAVFRQNVLHVYGLDFLKTAHMDEIFSQFSHKFIEWINDSAANVIFAQADKARRALEALSFPKVNDEPWRRTPDILVSEDMPPIFLQMRLATTLDTKATKKAMPALPMQQSWGRQKGVNGKQQRGQGRGRQDEDSLATKRPKPEPTEEERARRQKRAQRFGDWLVAAAKEATSSAAMEEVTDEERERRRKRAERFGELETATEGTGEAALATNGASSDGATATAQGEDTDKAQAEGK